MVVDHSLFRIIPSLDNLGLPKTVFSLPAEKEERIKILLCALSVAQGMEEISQQIDFFIYFSIQHLKLKIASTTYSIILQIQKSKNNKKIKKNPTKTTKQNKITTPPHQENKQTNKLFLNVLLII